MNFFYIRETFFSHAEGEFVFGFMSKVSHYVFMEGEIMTAEEIGQLLGGN